MPKFNQNGSIVQEGKQTDFNISRDQNIHNTCLSHNIIDDSSDCEGSEEEKESSTELAEAQMYSNMCRVVSQHVLRNNRNKSEKQCSMKNCTKTVKTRSVQVQCDIGWDRLEVHNFFNREKLLQGRGYQELTDPHTTSTNLEKFTMDQFGNLSSFQIFKIHPDFRPSSCGSVLSYEEMVVFDICRPGTKSLKLSKPIAQSRPVQVKKLKKTKNDVSSKLQGPSTTKTNGTFDENIDVTKDVEFKNYKLTSKGYKQHQKFGAVENDVERHPYITGDKFGIYDSISKRVKLDDKESGKAEDTVKKKNNFENDNVSVSSPGIFNTDEKINNVRRSTRIKKPVKVDTSIVYVIKESKKINKKVVPCEKHDVSKKQNKHRGSYEKIEDQNRNTVTPTNGQVKELFIPLTQRSLRSNDRNWMKPNKNILENTVVSGPTKEIFIPLTQRTWKSLSGNGMKPNKRVCERNNVSETTPLRSSSFPSRHKCRKLYSPSVWLNSEEFEKLQLQEENTGNCRIRLLW